MRMAYRTGFGGKMFDGALLLIMLAVIGVTLFPFLHVLAVSLSSTLPVAQGRVSIVPIQLTLDSYKLIALDKLIWRSFYNTVVYALSGTVISVLFSAMFAYALSVKTYRLRKATTLVLIVTMFFGGGMIPTYLVVRELGLINTIGAMVLPGAISAWNVLVMRTFFMGIPDSLRESAKIDGANDVYILFKIIMPLSKPVLAVIALFCMVNHWNDFFSALLYLTENNKYPLQMILRKVLFQFESAEFLGEMGRNMLRESQVSPKNLQNAMIIFTSIPVICMYPFLQKHFAKGMLIGSVKG